jgi:hypothetical protein
MAQEFIRSVGRASGKNENPGDGQSNGQARKPGHVGKVLLLSAIVVVIAVSRVLAMAATLARLFQLTPPVLRLPAVCAVLALRFVQAYLRFANALLALVITIARLRRNQAAHQQK